MFRCGMLATGFCNKMMETMYQFNIHEVESKSRGGWIVYRNESAGMKGELIDPVKQIILILVKEILEKSSQTFECILFTDFS